MTTKWFEHQPIKGNREITMSTEPLSMQKLREMVIETLREHHITLGEFLNADIDDFKDTQLRDLYLMTHNVLKGDTQ